MERSKTLEAFKTLIAGVRKYAIDINKFPAQVPSYKTETEALVSKFFDLIAALESLVKALEGTTLSSKYDGIANNLHDVVYSIDLTMDDVHEIVQIGFRDAKKAKLPLPEAYRKVWEDLYIDDSGCTLYRRLKVYEQLLSELTHVLREGYANPIIRNFRLNLT